MSKKNTTKVIKIVVPVLVVGVLAGATAAIVMNINKDKNRNEKYDPADKLSETDFYKDLTDDEKKEFDEELKKITDSEVYEKASDEIKDKFIDKFVDSQKTLHEIKNDEPDVNPETIVIPEDATEEERAELEQEKAYWETIDTVKDKVLSESGLINRKNSTVRNILGVYVNDGMDGATIYVKAQFVNKETFGGFEFCSLTTEYLQIVPERIFDQGATYEEVLELIDNAIATRTLSTCSDINNPAHINYFNENKDDVCNDFSYYFRLGYQASVYESWAGESSEHPDFLIKLEQEGKETIYTFVKYYAGNDRTGEPGHYGSIGLRRACPEFWNRLEGKEAQTQGAEATASAQSYETENGFDYNAYSENKNQQQDSSESQDVEIVEGLNFGI